MQRYDALAYNTHRGNSLLLVIFLYQIYVKQIAGSKLNGSYFAGFTYIYLFIFIYTMFGMDQLSLKSIVCLFGHLFTYMSLNRKKIQSSSDYRHKLVLLLTFLVAVAYTQVMIHSNFSLLWWIILTA